MPISKNELETLATKGDLVEMLEVIRSLITQAQSSLKEDFHTMLVGQRPTPRFLSPVQFAELLAAKPGGRRFHPDTIRLWCKSGRIKASQEGGLRSSWLIPYEELDRIHDHASMIEPELR